MEELERKEEKYPSNAYHDIKPRPLDSNKKKKEDPKPVAKGKEKKRSLMERLTDSFVSTSGDDIKDRVIFDWVIPGIKNILEDIVHMVLFGEKTDPRITRSRGESRLNRVAYDQRYEQRRLKDEYIPSPQRRTREPQITFSTRGEAEDVLTRMFDIVSEYQRATMKDLYSLSDMPTDFAMSNWGWRDLTGSSIVETRGGYVLKMPKAEELRRQ